MTSDAPIMQNGTLGSHAAACVAAGLCTLPAIRRGDEKRVALAAWKPYQSRLPSEEELDQWFGSSVTAICFVCGAVSGNLEMIDFDLGGEAFEPWREAVEAQAPGLIDRLVMESTPSGGRHVVYRCTGAVSGNLKLAQRRIVTGGEGEIIVGTKAFRPRQDASGDWVVDVTMIETRGQGGVFLCAPSDGYELLQGDFRDLPAITAEEREVLLGCAWALDEIPKPIVDGPIRQSSGSQEEDKRKISGSGVAVRPGDDYNERGEPRDVLRSHGWTLVRTGDNEYWRRPGKSAGTSATLKDRVFYVFSTNAAPFEAHTGYSPFALYTLLEHAGDFSAAASALATEGYGQLDDATRGVDLSGFTVPPAIEEPGDVLPVPVCVGYLVEAYPRLRRPVIHGLLREGETMNVIASPKTGKSWLTIDLAIAVATGRAWLGRYETVPGEVLIIDNELHRETSAHRIPKVAAARAVAMREFGTRIHIDNLRGRLRDIQKLEPYFRALEAERYKIIVLDAFYRFMPQGGDENDNATMANIYNLIDSL
ncbi:MAG: AAA family ATPase, partial [Planctomycetota bacterium]